MRTILFLFIMTLSFTVSKAQWVELDPGVNDALFDIYAITPDIAVAVGANGTIIKTIDGGETWVQKESGTTESLRKVQFPTPDIGYISGFNGTLLKSINEGETWNQIDIEVNANFSGLSCVNENLIYLSNIEILLKSNDGGNSWNDYLGFPGGSIQFLSEDIGFTHGFGNSFYKTTNGGVNWTELAYAAPFYFLTENVGFIYDGILLKTIDGGESFFNWPCGGTGVELRDIYSTSNNNVWGIISGDLGGNPSSQGIINIKSEPCNETIAWDNDDTRDMLSIHFKEEIGYVVGVHNGLGAIWKNDTGTNTMNLDEPIVINEIKIYPNPIKDTLNIDLGEIVTEINIILTDMSGKQVISESHKQKDKLSLNTKHLPNGVYVLSILSKQHKFSRKIIIN